MHVAGCVMNLRNPLSLVKLGHGEFMIWQYHYCNSLLKLLLSNDLRSSDFTSFKMLTF